MFKKNSWIVVLIMALTLTPLFTGCIDALADGDGGVTYTEVELGEFNIWGGQGYQRGWAVGGMKFLGVGDKAEVSADKGYKNEDFQKATKLIIEMEDATHPNGNLDIIWGAADADGGTVGLDWVQTGAIKTTKEGNILTVDLTAMKDYGKFKSPAFAKRKLILQAGAEKAGLPFVKKATLLIPNIVEKFEPVTSIEVKRKKAFLNKEFVLSGTVKPANATYQTIVWSIVGFLPKDGDEGDLEADPPVVGDWLLISGKPDGTTAEKTEYDTSKAALQAKVNFKQVDKILTPEQPAITGWDYSVWPPEEITFQEKQPAVPSTKKNNINGTLIATAEGTVRVKAIVFDGGAKEKELDKSGKETGKLLDTNYEEIFTISVTDPIPLTFSLGGASVSTQEWSAVANTGEESEMTVEAGGKFTLDFGGGYGNSYYYFEVDFDKEKLSDYSGLTFKYDVVSGDGGNKTIRVKAALDPPEGGYNPGDDIARSTENSISSGDTVNIKFGINGDAADDTFATNVTKLSAQNKIYIWFFPWAGAVKFTISEVNFYKTPLTYKVGSQGKETVEYYAFSNTGGGTKSSNVLVSESGTSYTSTYASEGNQGYNGNQVWIKIDLGTKTLADFIDQTDFTKAGGIKFKYKAETDSANDQNIRVKALATKPTGPGNGPGQYISWTIKSGTATTDAVQMDARLGYNQQAEADGSDTTTNIKLDDLNDKSVLYIWIYPNINNGSFTISDIELYEKKE